ncbi:MAG: universal stress protein [Alphaproteobacteria bacterium]|nr:universal stress protein [Alphaproteobacteria bacterium]
MAAKSKKNEMPERIFLVVIDKSEEMGVALRFASRRAQRTGGRVALLYVIPPPDFGHWMAVDNLIEEEARAEAEELIQQYGDQVVSLMRKLPVMHIREGEPRDELLALIEEEPDISVLVLASSPGPKGPGPLITALTGKFSSNLTIPLTIVPGTLSDEEVDALT